MGWGRAVYIGSEVYIESDTYCQILYKFEEIILDRVK